MAANDRVVKQIVDVGRRFRSLAEPSGRHRHQHQALKDRCPCRAPTAPLPGLSGAVPVHADGAVSRPSSGTGLWTGSVRSKAKAMDPEIARNQNYDDHHANDSEDVHSALLPLHDESRSVLAHPMYPPL
jgi:hypothetical protein